MNSPMDGAFMSELSDWLDASADSYVVDRTLKQTSQETTQVVYRRDPAGNPSIGPFVRKVFSSDAGRGLMYQEILRAQTQGVRLAHQPLVYSCEQTSAGLEIVQEYIPGTTLRELVQREGPGQDLAQRIMPQLCDAVHELHESLPQPLIHRDVKPSNVMVTPEGRVVLVDLGIARAWQPDAERDTVRYGTPGYAPPEQFGYGQTSVRSDVYALGMTLAFCLTAEDPTADLRERKFQDPRIPRALQPVLVRATQFDPDQRYQTVQALLADFERATGSPQGSQKGAAAPARRVPPALGIAWNVLLALTWVLMSYSCVVSVARPTSENADYPLWFVVLEYVGLLFVPWTLGTYVLAYKRWLRKHEPFRSLSWKVELPVCLVVAAISMASVVLVYNLVVAH